MLEHPTPSGDVGLQFLFLPIAAPTFSPLPRQLSPKSWLCVTNGAPVSLQLAVIVIELFTLHPELLFCI